MVACKCEGVETAKGRGRRFRTTHKSSRPCLYSLKISANILVFAAGIAQLVEQRIRNAKVVGSTPIAGTTRFKQKASSMELAFSFSADKNR